MVGTQCHHLSGLRHVGRRDGQCTMWYHEGPLVVYWHDHHLVPVLQNMVPELWPVVLLVMIPQASYLLLQLWYNLVVTRGKDVSRG